MSWRERIEVIDVIHIVVAMKPIEGNFAQNALEHGVAGINVDETRIEGENPSINIRAASRKAGRCSSYAGINREETVSLELAGHLVDKRKFETYAPDRPSEHLGRWPANIIHDGSEEVKDQFPLNAGWGRWANKGIRSSEVDGDSGSASRFFKECEPDK